MFLGLILFLGFALLIDRTGFKPEYSIELESWFVWLQLRKKFNYGFDPSYLSILSFKYRLPLGDKLFSKD